ncbi:hypothetical protein PCANB_001619 [Pneumocystis canis]|nr:hypothetical protein PCANB_001619 [Pneumocystis canis]
MGTCFSCTYDPETLRSREIDAYLRQDEELLMKQRFYYSASAGESGKTTILKQMRLIHMSGFTQEEREYYRTIVFSNMLQSMRLIIEAMEEFDICFDRPENEQYLDLLLQDRELTDRENLPPEYYRPLISLWEDAGVTRAVNRGNEYALHDNCFYFFENIHRLFDRKYIPTDQDILRCRLKTTGITETCFKVSGLIYRMIDVGGQRSERRKWIHCFENVTAVLFLVAISGYDQCLIEDNGSNQMQEALVLFDSICNSQWFINTSIILFLNKIDLFKVKLHVSLISNYFPDFNNDNQNDYRASCLFFRKKFLELNRNHQKTIYTHFTNATDTTLLKNVMISVSDIIFNQNLQNLML